MRYFSNITVKDYSWNPILSTINNYLVFPDGEKINNLYLDYLTKKSRWNHSTISFVQPKFRRRPVISLACSQQVRRSYQAIRIRGRNESLYRSFERRSDDAVRSTIFFLFLCKKELKSRDSSADKTRLRQVTNYLSKQKDKKKYTDLLIYDFCMCHDNMNRTFKATV